MSENSRAPAPLYAFRVSAVTPPEPVAVPPCVVCDATNAAVTYRVETVESPIVVCSECHLGYYHPMPPTETVADFYAADYYGAAGIKFRPYIEELVHILTRRQAKRLTRGMAPGSRILDVGCGRGVLAAALADLGFSAHGFEINDNVARHMDPRVKLSVAPDLTRAELALEGFDEVILWHVLEHLRTPREILVECRRILRPGGRLVVATPNFGSAQARWSGATWFHLDPPRHLFHFPVVTLTRLLERTGFTCSSTHHFSMMQDPFGWVQSAMNRSSRWRRNALYDAMYRKEDGDRVNLSKLEMLGILLAAMPAAFSLSMVTAALGQGATVHVIAHRPS